MRYVEIQCDGLVGPTHNYAGLSHGNVASKTHALSVSYPRRAALQGLEKMWRVAALGIPQLMIPPQERPNLALLREHGCTGDAGALLAQAARENPLLLAAAWSASSMWAANMATVSPAPDTADGTLHLTPANLVSTLHRAQEAVASYEMLQKIFARAGVMLHPPLPSALPDEGAANHMRLAAEHGMPGVEIFVYGRAVTATLGPRAFPARQAREAAETIARHHHVPPERCVFVQQNPEAIDAGVFHNDVIAMSNGNLLLYHEKAFLDEAAFLEEVRSKLMPTPLLAVRVDERELSLKDAVAGYLFNSQLLSLPVGGMALLAPAECETMPPARALLERWKRDPANPIREVHYLDVRESMRNGGGPACLRLRVVLEEEKLRLLPRGVWLEEAQYSKLKSLISGTYPEEITPEALLDPTLAEQCIGISREIHRKLGL